MNTGLVSIRYAKALLQTGIEKKELAEVFYNQANNFFLILNESKEFDDFIKNPVIKKSQKKQTVRHIFSSFHEILLNFIEVIIDNQREKLITDIFRDFLDMYRKYAGIKNITVYTAISFDNKYKNEILEILSKRLNTKIELECKVEPDIIGGLVIVSGDKQADSSIAGELRALKKIMMN